MDVCDEGGKFVGCGYFNLDGVILLWMLVWEVCDIDLNFYCEWVWVVLVWCEGCIIGMNVMWVLYVEVDGLLGVVVD